MNERIGETVRLLLEAGHQSRESLAGVLGISLRTMHRRINGQEPWRADELAVLADHFEVPAQVFFDGPAALFSVPVRVASSFRCIVPPLVA